MRTIHFRCCPQTSINLSLPRILAASTFGSNRHGIYCLKRLPDSLELHATLSLNTHSVLRVQEEDLRNSEATYFDRISAERFAALVQNAVQSLYFGAAAAEFDLHWRREVDRIQFQCLSTMLT